MATTGPRLAARVRTHEKMKRIWTLRPSAKNILRIFAGQNEDLRDSCSNTHSNALLLPRIHSVRIKYIFGVFTIQWHTHNMVLKKKVLTNKMVPMEYAYLRRGLTLLGNAVILAHYIKLHCKYGVITYLPCQIWEGDLGRCGGNEACSSLFFWFTYILALFFLTAEYSCSCKDLATHVHSLWKWHIYGLLYAVLPRQLKIPNFHIFALLKHYYLAVYYVPKTKCDFFQWFSDSVWYTLLLMIACYLAEKHNKKLFAVSQQLGEKSTVQ